MGLADTSIAPHLGEPWDALLEIVEAFKAGELGVCFNEIEDGLVGFAIRSQNLVARWREVCFGLPKPVRSLLRLGKERSLAIVGESGSFTTEKRGIGKNYRVSRLNEGKKSE
jgi:hypothetical protein